VVLFGEYFQLELAKAARSEDVFSVVSDVASAWPDHPEISQFAIDRNRKHDLKATTHCTTHQCLRRFEQPKRLSKFFNGLSKYSTLEFRFTTTKKLTETFMTISVFR